LKKKLLSEKKVEKNAVKKNKQPAHTPGGPGRLRSWSGPVETDFQGGRDSAPITGLALMLLSSTL
jgi:hypothetical protein